MKLSPTVNDNVTGSVKGQVKQLGSSLPVQSSSQCNVTASAVKLIIVPYRNKGLTSN